jgi:micrococcal nuclease
VPRVDSGIRFWGLIAVLLGMSVYFGVNAESRRREVTTSEAALQTDDLVRLAQVVDGDTVLVTTDAGQKVAVRILGIKAFDAKADRDPTARFGKAAVDELSRSMTNEPVRVAVDATPKDRHGRTLATLYVGGKDVGLALVKQGLALVYTVHPFPAMSLYLEQQEAARADRRGLWADPAVVGPADLLQKNWQKEAE